MIVDPMPAGQSVQFELFLSIGSKLRSEFDVTLASVYLNDNRIDAFSKQGLHSLCAGRNALRLDSLLSLLGKENESMLWLESWLREGMFSRNSREFKKVLEGKEFDYVVNATNTVPIESDLWWTQGPPLMTTLDEMASSNFLAWMASRLGRRAIESIDSKLVSEMSRVSGITVANSRYSERIYKLMGCNISGVIFNTKDFSSFKPSTNSPERDYVLTYFGKETDFEPILELASRGVRIVAFGSKLPLGMNLGQLSKLVDFRGKVTHEELVGLYSNALFTLFPFTNEPFGYIPIESMACGTPVLSYGKQGPSETILDQRTGWLVESQKDIERKAVELWEAGSVDGFPFRCMERAAKFDPSYSARQLANVLTKGGTRD